MLFKERLIENRIAMGLTKKEVAEKISVEQSTYGKYELGQRQPSLEILQKLSEFFQVSTDYLLGNTDSPTPISAKESEKIGDKIRELRVERKVSQQYVATALGISRQTYNNYELNKREPDYSTIKELAEFFQVSTDYLLGNTDSPTPISAKESEKKEISIEDFLSSQGIEDAEFLETMQRIIKLKKMVEHNKELDNELGNEFASKD